MRCPIPDSRVRIGSTSTLRNGDAWHMASWRTIPQSKTFLSQVCRGQSARSHSDVPSPSPRTGKAFSTWDSRIRPISSHTSYIWIFLPGQKSGNLESYWVWVCHRTAKHTFHLYVAQGPRSPVCQQCLGR